MVTPTEPFHTISVDGLGPYTPVAVGGYTRAILATCGATLFQMGKLIKKYNGRELVSFLNDIVALAKSKKFVVKVVRYDAGSVENSEEVKHFLRLHQMEGRAALPEHQNQNPVERSVRTIKETVAANMIDQKTLGAAYWGLCFIMAVKQRNMVPNVLCPDSSPSIEVLGQSVDVALSGTHFFGEVVVVPKQGYRSGKKMAIGETRNELAHIVGYGKNYNGGWLVQRLAKPLSRPVERKNPQSLIGLPDKELTEVIGKDWLPVTRADGTIEIRSRAPIAPVMGALQWHTVDPEEGSVDPLDVTWSDSDMRVAGPESQKAVGVSDEEELFRQEDAILMKVFGEVGEDGVRRSGRERRPVDSFIPLDKFSDERDYDWDQGRVNYMDYGENVESDVPGYMAFLAVKKPSISHKYTLTSPDAEQWDKA
jgi:hypothetical protein